MNRIKAILVDDEPRGISSLQKLLEMNCPEVEVISTCSDSMIAADIILSLKPELLFLDIAMPGKNGFELLKDLKESEFELILVTAHNNFMTQAFQFSAIDYLLKPVDEDLLIEAVQRAIRKIREKNGSFRLDTLLYNAQLQGGKQKMKLCIPSLKGFQVIELQTIIYCEAESNYTNFYFSERTPVCASKSIHEYEKLLADCGFIRIHKSYLVNLEHIKEYIRGEGGNLILSNGHIIEVSRRKKDLMLSKMKEFYKF